ncbi:hypothetical protein [Azospirillum sp. sgz302134]
MIGRPSPPKRQAPPAPMISAAQRQREVAKLLMRLDAMLKSSGDLAAAARERVSVGGMGRYRKFTKKVRDFFALAAVTQERLDAAPSEMEELIGPMTTALERLHARMVILFVEESAGFFGTFARVKALPIGTHEIVGVELRALLEIRKFLDDPLYDGERGQTLRAQTDRIAGLMRVVMDRCPPLPDFGDEPSIGPRGAVNKPIRPPRRTAPDPRQPPARPTPPPLPQPDPRLEVRPLTFDDMDDEDA